MLNVLKSKCLSSVSSGAEKGKPVICYVKLEDIVKNNGSETPSKTRINNLEKEAKSKGLEPIDPELVFPHLVNTLGREIDYNVRTRNCEHFITAFKYDSAFSKQVDDACKILVTIVGTVTITLVICFAEY